MASGYLAPHSGTFRGQARFTTFSNGGTDHHGVAAQSLSAEITRPICSSRLQESTKCSSLQNNVAPRRPFLSTLRGASSLFLRGAPLGNGAVRGRGDYGRSTGGDKRLESARLAVRAEQEEAAEEKPKRRRAAPRAKKADTPADASGESETPSPTPKRATSRRRTTKAKEDGDAAVDSEASGAPPRRTRAPRKKAAAQEEAGPSASDLREEEARGGDELTVGKTRGRRKASTGESDTDDEPSRVIDATEGALKNATEGASENAAEGATVEQDKDGAENGAAGHSDGNGAAAPRIIDEESSGGSERKVVVAQWVGGAGSKGGDGRPPRDSVTAEVLGDDEELRVIAQKIVDGRARDLKLRPELDKLLDHFFMQECTKCHKVFVGRRPAPEQPYYGICRRPSDGNRWRNEAHDIVDTHVPSAITQPYPITHKLGSQTRYRYRVPAIFAICQMAGATFPSTDNEFFDCIRRHDSRYEPFHIGALDLDQPPPPGGWRKDDAELLATETRKQKLDMLRLRGHEFQDTYMPDDTGMTPKTFGDRSIPMDLQGDWNSISRSKDRYRP
ncbi:hypothetical protein KFL_005130120 [Klebsormidium nitens]|uniref:Uncharacterized protein n=1 Tax=Klebsormidium nitens TaxID=105231 RepID=A0A1Y1IH14_KLENI|nr:hypothetical protein KFL_005130120 [Klebsormidium nitens]|eukprot:GAQ89352.1 hypothetical protein KFL_005130120 [Klebsormidium nitens]